MDLLYIENYFILSVFLAFFMIEIGISVISLARYSEYGRKLKKYLLPIWAIDGTFAVFYLVNLEAAYPLLLNTIGYAYVALVLFGGIFLVLRNLFIAYSELTRAKLNEKTYVRIYAVSTLAIAAIITYALSSGASGIGINIITKSIDATALLTSGFSLLMLLAVLILSVSSAIIYFDVGRFRYSGIAGMVLSLVLVVLAITNYAPQLATNLSHRIYLPIIALIAMGVTGILAMRSSTLAKYALMASLIISVNLYGMVQYPYLFGTQPITAYANNAQTSNYVIAFTTAGMAIVIVSLLCLFYMAHKARR